MSARLRRIICGLGLLGAAVGASGRAQAGDWLITPSFGIYESWTDNAKLDPPGDAKWDFVTNFVPAIAIHGQGARFSLDLNASLNAFVYARDSSLDGVNVNLQETNTTELVSDMLFLDTHAFVGQVAAQPGSSVSGSDHTAQQGSTVAAFLVSPYLRNHFGNFADSELRYTFSQVLSGSGQLSNEMTNEISAGLVSGVEFNRLRWALTGDASFSHLGASNDSSSRNTSHIFIAANAEYALSRQWSLLASVGYERIRDDTLDSQPNGPIGSVGFHWRPGPKTSLQLEYNHRFNENFLSGEFSYQLSPQTLLTARYSEGIQTTQSLFTDTVGFLTTDEAGNFIDQRTAQIFSLGNDGFGFDNGAFRQRVFTVDFTSTFERDTLTANGYFELRNGQGTGEQTAFGGSISWHHDLNEDDHLGVVLRYQRFDGSSDGGTDDLIGAGVWLTHNFSNTLQGVILYNFTDQLSSQRSNRFVENVVTIGLQKTF